MWSKLPHESKLYWNIMGGKKRINRSEKATVSQVKKVLNSGAIKNDPQAFCWMNHNIDWFKLMNMSITYFYITIINIFDFKRNHLLFQPYFVDDPIAAPIYSFPALFWGTVVPLSIWVKIYFVYFNLLAISAFLLSKAVASGY